MNNPTLLGSLLTGLITGVIALSGVIYTQRRADRRERDQWEREREHERSLWEREEAARTFQQRREGYSNFYEVLRSTAKIIFDAGNLNRTVPAAEWHYPVYQELLRLELYATPKVRELANTAYSALLHWGRTVDLEALRRQAAAVVDAHEGRAVPMPGPEDFGSKAFREGEEAYEAAQQRMVRMMRRDLGVPND